MNGHHAMPGVRSTLCAAAPIVTSRSDGLRPPVGIDALSAVSDARVHRVFGYDDVTRVRDRRFDRQRLDGLLANASVLSPAAVLSIISPLRTSRLIESRFAL